MNPTVHHSGQFSAQVQNQADTMLPRLPQQSGSSVPQIQNPAKNDYVIRHKYLQEKIWEFLMQRRQQPLPTKKMADIVKRIEDALFKNAKSADEFLNLATLENRLHLLLKGLHMSNQNQQLSNANSSPSVGTMIPTPGLQQASNLAGTSSMDTSFLVNKSSNAISSSGFNSGSFMPNENLSSMGFHNDSLSSSGAMSGGFQHAVGNNLMAPQRTTSQMIPTPGFNSSNNTDMNIQSLTNSESTNNVGAFSAVESLVGSQPMQQTPQFVGQNSRILHNIGGHLGSGIRSTLQQRSYGLSNGPLKGGLGMMGNNMSMMNGPKAETVYANNTRLWQQQLNQHQQPLIQGDGGGIGGADASGSGNMYVPVTSSGSVMNNQNLNVMSMQSMATQNTSSNAQSNVHSTQFVTNLKPQISDQYEKMTLQSQHTVRENFVQNPRVQQRMHQVQQGQLNNLSQFLPKNDNFGKSQISRSMVSDHTTESYNGGIQSQFSGMQNQFVQENYIEDRSRANQLLPHSSDPLDITSSMGQPSDQMMQQMYPQQFAANQQTDFGLSQQDMTMHDQWYSISQDNPNASSSSIPLNQGIEDQFNQRITGQGEAQLNGLSLHEPLSAQKDTSNPMLPSNENNAVSQPHNRERERQYWNQQRWLLFLRHARRCSAPEGKCLESNCSTAQTLLKHMENCNESRCPYPRCSATKGLIDHHRHCRDSKCPVCIPVKNYVQKHLKAVARSDSANGSCAPHDIAKLSEKSNPKACLVISETPEDLQPSTKRVKLQQNQSETSVPLSCPPSEPPSVVGSRSSVNHPNSFVPEQSEVAEVKAEETGNIGQLVSNDIDMVRDNLGDAYMKMPEGDPAESNNSGGFSVRVVKSEKEMVQPKTEKVLQPQEVGSKSGKPKIMGVSLTELFTPEQVRQHITGLRQWVGQSKAKAEKNQAMGRSMSENSCQLCAVENLTFEPPPIYCTPCGARIKKNASYYTVAAGDTRHYVCIHCYNEARGDTILVDGNSIPKAKMAKKKNDEETDESWVQCDKCEAWQHQICALFNSRRNEGGQAEYTCPNCYIKEVERGERMPLPQSAVLGAKDLPRTILSDHVEQRLFAKLKIERQERARVQGKSYDEVPGAESLVVRVVSSVDKKLEVKPRFLEIFQEENYPTEFPYKSKVVLLFQNIEGVEVCLFGMYVQEFGSECQQPNQRRVYLSYLDSVKYFRPDVKTVKGEALRTFVYHEILIGYLEYCKLRGFTSCYIWACPPLKGEDYILYCHPEIQKTPKSDKLREWYLSMLKKATREKVVADLTNLYDHFFVSTGECKAKVTAARLPYFDGDYWPGAAEDMIYQLQQEEDGKKPFKKGMIKKTITKRAMKASGQIDLSGNVSKDLLLMHRLGEIISPMKEDFIMVHLQHPCTHCCILMVSGNRWVCKQCKNFQLCDKCYDVERKREDRERHPINQKDKHPLYPIEITDVPEDTKDKDEILESEFFDTRQAFLSLCQGNHYQYDTLRRAKHSSMMVLYHLHNPTAPAFVTTCNVCHLEIETGQGWRCETCPDYDLCNACYLKDGGMSHPHKLTNNPSSDRDAQNKEARQLRVKQLRKMLDLLVHASLCRSPQCQYPNCRKVKGLFRHGMVCKKRVSGNCSMCKKMWYLLQLHARACKVSHCSVPRCKDLKDHMRRSQQQSESRRRAAVNEMMRQRATEVAGSS